MSERLRLTISIDDTRLSMLVAGPESGAPVLLLHGLPASAELWRVGLSRLSEAGFRAFAPDLPGYGQTSLPDGADRSLRGAAEALATWLRQDGVLPVWIVGHDLGGGVAQIMAVHYPELVNCLTLSHAAVEDLWPIPSVRLLRLLARLGLYPMLAASGLIDKNPYFARQLRKSVADPDLFDDSHLLRRVFFDTKVTDPRGRREFNAHLAALDNRHTAAVAPRLRGIQAPTLLLWGRDDPFQPWESTGVRLRQLLPDSHIILLNNASHFAMLDQPDAFYGALIEWRQSQPPPVRHSAFA